MNLLIAGVLLFIAVHLVPSAVSLRQGLVQRLGAGPYKGIFSLLSLLGLVLLVFGKAKAPFITVWEPPLWSRHVALALMPFSLILLTAAYLPSNIKRVTPHPMLWGVTLWAIAHLVANGDLASILLFGGFGAYAQFDIWSANRRGAKTSTTRHAVGKDATVIIVGLVAYIALLFLHPYLFGVSPLR